MLFELGQLLRASGATIGNVLHVGAHRGEEVAQYLKYGAHRITLIEQDPTLAALLSQEYSDDERVTVIEATIGEVSGVETELWLATNGQSSSIFEPELHLIEHPDVAFFEPENRQLTRLDDLIGSDEAIDLLNLDIQGAELAAIKSLGDNISSVSIIYSEINRKPLYRGIPLVADIDEYLEKCGFTRCATAWSSHGWGDAIYLNRRTFNFGAALRLRALGLLRRLSPKGVARVFRLSGAILGQLTRGRKPESHGIE